MLFVCLEQNMHTNEHKVNCDFIKALKIIFFQNHLSSLLNVTKP